MMFIVVTLTGGLILPSHGQKQQSFDQLVERGESLLDSLPGKAKFYFLQALAQAEGQSAQKLATLYNELGDALQVEANYDSSSLFYRKGLVLAERSNNNKELILSHQGIADNMRNLAQKDSSHLYLGKAIAIAKKNKMYVEAASIYSDLGNVYRDEDDLEKSLSHYIKAASLFDSLHDQGGASRALSNLANVHYLLGNYDKALDYVRQSNTMALAVSFQKGIAYNHKLSGRVYRKKKDIAKALEEYKIAWDTYEKLGDKFSMSETSLGIGNLRYDQEDYRGAIKDYNTGLQLGRSIGVKSLMAYCYSALGFAMMEMKQWKSSSAYMDSTIVAATESKYAHLVLDAYDILSDVEEKQGHLDKSIDYLRKYIDLKDSLTQTENRSAIEQAEAKYQNDRKTTEIEILHRDQQLQAAAIQRNRIIAIAIGVALLAVIVIAFLLLNRYRLLGETKRQIEMERMRNQIARDLHDDIGSTLSSINIISQVAMKDNGNTTVPHLKRIHDHSSKIMESMSDIVWSIHPDNDSMERVVAKMKEFCGEILDPKEIGYTFNQPELLSTMRLTAESRKNLFLIFKEIVNNAAKYSNATNVSVVFERDLRSWSMEVADDGQGFDRAAISSGNGLNNMIRRAEIMNAKLEITAAPGRGTRININVIT